MDNLVFELDMISYNSIDAGSIVMEIHGLTSKKISNVLVLRCSPTIDVKDLLRFLVPNMIWHLVQNQ